MLSLDYTFENFKCTTNTGSEYQDKFFLIFTSSLKYYSANGGIIHWYNVKKLYHLIDFIIPWLISISASLMSTKPKCLKGVFLAQAYPLLMP